MARSRDELETYFKEKKVDGADELLADIDALIDGEKQTGIKSKNKVDAEAKKLRDSMKSLGVFKSLAEKLGFKDGETDLEEFETEVLAKVKGDGKGGKSSDDSEVQKQLKLLAKRLDVAEKGKQEAEQKSNELLERTRRRTTQDLLTKALTTDKGQPKMFGQDLLVKDLITSGRVKLAADESKVVFVKGEDEVDMDAGLKELMTERKDLLINYQTGGAGTGSSGAPASGNKSDRTDAERVKALRAGQQSSRFL